MKSEGRPDAAETRPEPRWGLGDAAGGFAVALILNAFVASLWLGATGDKELDLAGKGAAQLGLWAGLVGAAVLASHRKGARRLAVDFGFRGVPLDLPVGVAVGVLAQLVVVPGIALLLQPLLGDPDTSGPVEDLFRDAHGAVLLGLLLFTVIGAPVVEELFFRGLVLRSLERRLGAAAAVVLSGVLFGLGHPQPLSAEGLILVMVTLSVFGALLAALVVRTGRLGPAIVAHAAFNGWTAYFLLAG